MSERDWTVENTEWPVWMKGLDGEEYTQQPEKLPDRMVENIEDDPRVRKALLERLIKQLEPGTGEIAKQLLEDLDTYRCCGDSGDCTCDRT